MKNTDVNFALDGKRVLVTGASEGLGRHFAQLLARAGATVAIVARNADKLEELASQIEADGGTAIWTTMDVTCSESVARGLDFFVSSVGVPDIVVNNAGRTIARPILKQSEADWDAVIDTNLKGCWLVATEAARRMVEVGKEGNIINVASILGQRVAGGVAPYAISKAGVLHATKAMALEFARFGIRVNSLLPGYISTNLNREFLASEDGMRLRKRIPSRRLNEMTDLDGPLLLLASDAGRGMSGACVAVDGAHLVSSL
ncbi:2-deoxy-D-gluconate 3-dehydrogenase [Paraburkholderia phytofirmans OLGA172]|uniref:2-deoxy-D-gluconate 3-dehydrogenase n=1 Tax=Paraburkholderia phytofirmans OLGA172 TaxID=1417228 RepID=A0A160FJB9_9BURK|nr:SDR family NAD(P)-dependent oxidoreductase [Paraburkholderia phytofirmans]ANB72391.1 2-deoxy-D-gluconate 3-dehydrogenase [Paraburkholderia phytofirmans OLGA172]